MKVLLRNYDGKEYVWMTAKYDGKKFVVNGIPMDERMVVSIINDNRKNYVKCSSCGKIFPKNGNQFAIHQELAETDAPCLQCHKLRVNERTEATKKFARNDDGTYTMKSETQVDLYCRWSLYSHYNIDSWDVKAFCAFRQCGTAHAMEIDDTFTIWPGAFDHIITVDKILDNGYESIGYMDDRVTEYILDSHLGITAYVNSLGIVDDFNINTRDRSAVLYYSKKYNILFTADGDGYYEVYCSDTNNEVLKYIANFYK